MLKQQTEVTEEHIRALRIGLWHLANSKSVEAAASLVFAADRWVLTGPQQRYVAALYDRLPDDVKEVAKESTYTYGAFCKYDVQELSVLPAGHRVFKEGNSVFVLSPLECRCYLRKPTNRKTPLAEMEPGWLFMTDPESDTVYTAAMFDGEVAGVHMESLSIVRPEEGYVVRYLDQLADGVRFRYSPDGPVDIKDERAHDTRPFKARGPLVFPEDV